MSDHVVHDLGGMPLITAPKRMTPTEGAALLQGAMLYDEMAGAVDARTLDILSRRRANRVVKSRGWLVRRALAAADVVGITLAFLFASWAVGGATPVDEIDPRTEYVLFLLTIPVWIIVAKLYGLYDHDEERTDHTTLDDIVPVVHLVTLGSWLLFAGAWITGLAVPHIEKVGLFWAAAIVLVITGRSIARALCRRSVFYLQNTVVVGAGDVGRMVARKFAMHPEYGINMVGFVDENPRAVGEEVETFNVLGSPDRLPAIVRFFDVERVVIAFSNDSHTETLELIRSLKDLDVQVDIVPRLFEIVGPSVGIHSVGGLPLVGLPPFHLSRSSLFVKRATDLVLGSLGLAVLAPTIGAIALAIKLTSPGPVFFGQVRMGAGDRTFRMLKFRTMVVDADERKHEYAHLNKHLSAGGDPRMFKIPDDPRITRIGRFLRRYSLDELPQLINVVRGEMTLVGPRPLILDEDRHVGEWARRRLDLKPGMTGPWQVLGRSEIPFDEMIKLDYLYVTNWSPWRDLKLMLQTIPAVIHTREVVY
jgi:exopolysaccharide biosynthesis polyprenyl glycosylphosphotransferase